MNIERLGNIGSASIPLALSQANEQGRIQTGDLVLLLAFGAGFHWAAMLLRFCRSREQCLLSGRRRGGSSAGD